MKIARITPFTAYETPLTEVEKGVEAFKAETKGLGAGAVALGAQALQAVVPDVIEPGFLQRGKEWGLRTAGEQFDSVQAPKYQPRIAKVEDIASVKDATDWAKYQGTKGLLNVASMALGAGVGGLIGKTLAKGAVSAGVKQYAKAEVGKRLGAELVTEAGQKVAKDQIKAAATKGLARGAIAGGTAFSFGMEGGDSFVSNVRDGVTPEDALVPGLAVGAVASMLDIVPGIMAAKYAGKTLKEARDGVRAAILADPTLAKRAVHIAKMAAKGVAAGVAMEGVTEGLQELVQIGGERWAKNEGFWDALDDEQRSQILNAAAAGGLTGGLIGGAGGAVRGGVEAVLTQPEQQTLPSGQQAPGQQTPPPPLPPPVTPQFNPPVAPSAAPFTGPSGTPWAPPPVVEPPVVEPPAAPTAKPPVVEDVKQRVFGEIQAAGLIPVRDAVGGQWTVTDQEGNAVEISEEIGAKLDVLDQLEPLEPLGELPPIPEQAPPFELTMPEAPREDPAAAPASPRIADPRQMEMDFGGFELTSPTEADLVQPVVEEPQAPLADPAQLEMDLPLPEEAPAAAAPLFERLVPPETETESDPGYLYHATSVENLQDILSTGQLDVFQPDYGTDQAVWPDGSEEPRSYWRPDSASTASFAPEEGQPVVVRAKKTDLFKEEGTGDLYRQDVLPAAELEVLTATGWEPLGTEPTVPDRETQLLAELNELGVTVKQDEEGNWGPYTADGGLASLELFDPETANLIETKLVELEDSFSEKYSNPAQRPAAPPATSSTPVVEQPRPDFQLTSEPPVVVEPPAAEPPDSWPSSQMELGLPATKEEGTRLAVLSKLEERGEQTDQQRTVLEQLRSRVGAEAAPAIAPIVRGSYSFQPAATRQEQEVRTTSYEPFPTKAEMRKGISAFAKENPWWDASEIIIEERPGGFVGVPVKKTERLIPTDREVLEEPQGAPQQMAENILDKVSVLRQVDRRNARSLAEELAEVALGPDYDSTSTATERRTRIQDRAKLIEQLVEGTLRPRNRADIAQALVQAAQAQTEGQPINWRGLFVKEPPNPAFDSIWNEIYDGDITKADPVQLQEAAQFAAQWKAAGSATTAPQMPVVVEEVNRRIAAEVEALGLKGRSQLSAEQRTKLEAFTPGALAPKAESVIASLREALKKQGPAAQAPVVQPPTTPPTASEIRNQTLEQTETVQVSEPRTEALLQNQAKALYLDGHITETRYKDVRDALLRKEFERVEAFLDEIDGIATVGGDARNAQVALSTSKQTAQMRVDLRRMLALNAQSAYEGGYIQTSLKETLQNSFDAVKKISKRLKGEGRINIRIDRDARTVSIEDNGVGMSKKDVHDFFLTLGGTGKGGIGSSGGMGLAKGQFLTGAEWFELTTTKGGYTTTLRATPDQIIDGQAETITEKTGAESGTVLTLKVPESYVNKRGEETSISFPYRIADIDVFQKPLLGPVEVVLFDNADSRGQTLPIGKHFDVEKNGTPLLTTVKFSWGKADIYYGKERKDYPSQYVLSDGIFQFHLRLQTPDYETVPYDMIVNVVSAVDTKDPSYPFNNTREGFRSSIQEDEKALRSYLIQISSGLASNEVAETFQNFKQLPRNVSTRGTELTPAEKAKGREALKEFVKEPPKKKDNPLAAVPRQVIVEGGRVESTKGEQLLKNEAKEKESMEADTNVIERKGIELEAGMDRSKPVFHNNTSVDYIAELGEDAAGFFADFGSVVVDFVEVVGEVGGWRYESFAASKKDSRVFGGVSIDKSYYGVHLKAAFTAMFLNPLHVREAKTLAGIANALYLTMIHEGAHHADMGHNQAHEGEIHRLFNVLADNAEDVQLKEKLGDVLYKYRAVYQQMREKFNESTTRNVAQSIDKTSKHNVAPAQPVLEGRDQRAAKDTAGSGRAQLGEGSLSEMESRVGVGIGVAENAQGAGTRAVTRSEFEWAVEREFGRNWLRRAVNLGVLKVNEVSPADAPSGVFDPATGVMTVNLDKIPIGENVLGVLLHEGSHQNLESMLGKSFGTWAQEVRELANSGNVIARRATLKALKEVAARFGVENRLAMLEGDALQAEVVRVNGLLGEKAGAVQHLQQEQLAYYVQYAAQEPSGLFRRIVNALRAWFASTGFGQRLKEMGLGPELSDGLMVELARRAAMQGMEFSSQVAHLRADGRVTEWARTFESAVWHAGPNAWGAEPGFPRGRPRLDKIGTGEGGQMFGWGWYSAENEEVSGPEGQYAKQFAGGWKIDGIVYEPTTTKTNTTAGNYAADALSRFGGDKAKAIEWLEDFGNELEAKKLLRAAKVEESDASVYRLDIPDEAITRMIQWEKPLNEQTEEVKAALEKAKVVVQPKEIKFRSVRKDKDGDYWADAVIPNKGLSAKALGKTAAEARQNAVKMLEQLAKRTGKSVWFGEGEPTGSAIYDALKEQLPSVPGEHPKKKVSEYLRSLGIVGNKYLDQGSRAGGVPTYNYVVWDQDVLDEVGRNHLDHQTGERMESRPDIGPVGARTLESFAGVNARNADRFDLSKAMQMLESGTHPDNVLKETGWFKWVDGKWRFELSDDQAKLKATLEQLEYSDFEAGEFNEYHLEQFLQHDKLFAAYPELRQMKLIYSKGGTKHDNVGGATFFDDDNNAVAILITDLAKDPLSTIMHEVQHTIQYAEGFAVGATMSVPKHLRHRSAGEVEAINTQTRLKWTDEDRRKIAPRRTQPIKESHIIVSYKGNELVDPLAPANAGVMESRPDAGPLWFSPLSAGIASLKQNKGPASQWKGMLFNGDVSKIPGVKMEEVEMLGLKEWLDVQQGTVTKEEILRFVDEGGVRLEEVIKPGPFDPDTYTGEWAVYGPAGEHVSDAMNRAQAEQWAAEMGEGYAVQPRDPDSSGDEPGGTKFGMYQLPGGENYRELLITIPRKTTTKSADKQYAVRERTSEPGVWELYDTATGQMRRGMSFVDREMADSTAAQLNVVKTTERMYKVPEEHGYGDAKSDINRVAHIRFNERTDAEGNRVLFVEEVQSDWSQEGRKKGFALDTKEKEELARLEELESGAFFDAAAEVDFGEQVNNPREITQAQENRLLELRNRTGPPPTPFKSTSSWAMLGMKRAIRWAVENGFDKVAWTPGEVQAERYSLAKQVDSLAFTQYPDGRFAIAGMKDKQSVLAINNDKDRVAPDKLASVVGKELAEKVIADFKTETGDYGLRTYSGVDLKVGGEKMKGFYDKILPAEMGKFLKKFGGRVETSQIVTDQGGAYDLSSAGLSSYDLSKKTQEAWSFTIPEKLQEAALGGMPMFSMWDIVKDPGQLLFAPLGNNSGNLSRAEKFTKYAVDRFDLMLQRQRREWFATKDGKKLMALGRDKDKALATLLSPQSGLPLDVKFQFLPTDLPLPEDQMVHEAFEAAPKRKSDRRGQMHERFVDPISKAAARFGMTMEDLNALAYARHAPEANERLRRVTAKGWLKDLIAVLPEAEAKRVRKEMAKAKEDTKQDMKERQKKYLQLIINNQVDPLTNKMLVPPDFANEWKQFYEQPSGMTDDDARDILLEYDPSQVATIFDMFDEMNRSVVAQLVEGGVLTQDQAAKWTGAYGHYATLKRLSHEDEGTGHGSGGVSVGKAARVRYGSPEPATEVFTNTVTSMERAMDLVENNRVMNNLKNFLEANPDKEFLRIVRQDVVHYLDEEGFVVEGAVRSKGLHDAVGFENGKMFIIQAANNEKARMIVGALNNMDAAQLGPIMRGFMAMTKWMAAMSTSWSPEFFFVNAPRDFLEALYNVQDQRDSAQVWKEMVKDYPKSAKALHKVFRARSKGKPVDLNDPWVKWVRAFEENGGPTGWMDVFEDTQSHRKALERRMKELSEGMNPHKALRSVLDWVEDYNAIAENVTRLSLFKALVGDLNNPRVPMERAIALAKNLTVNFNRRGDVGTVMGALFMFANAGIQGSVRIMTAMSRSATVRKMVIATIVFSALVDQLNRAMDDDDEYDKIPDYIKERNLVFMNPFGGNAVLIPAPWGYNFFWRLGSLMSEGFEHSQGRLDDWSPSGAAADVVSTFWNAFMPIHGATFAQSITPSVLRPVTQIAENKDAFGQALKPEPFPGQAIPQTEQYWSNASEISKFLAKLGGAATGGDDVTSGAVDISPAWIDRVVGELTGSVGRQLLSATSLPAKALEGDVEVRDVPVVRKFMAFPSEAQETARYHDRVSQVLDVERRLKAYSEGPRRDLEKARELRQHPLRRMAPMVEDVERQLKSLRTRLKAAQGRGDTEGEERLKEKMELVRRRFNTRWLAQLH